MKGCVSCKYCYFIKGSAFCASTKFKATKISEKQLYNKKGYCSGFKEKEDMKGGAE